jgi:hypothetical protein
MFLCLRTWLILVSSGVIPLTPPTHVTLPTALNLDLPIANPNPIRAASTCPFVLTPIMKEAKSASPLRVAEAKQ